MKGNELLVEFIKDVNKRSFIEHDKFTSMNGLIGEVGEVASVIKMLQFQEISEIAKNHYQSLNKNLNEELKKELGDMLFYSIQLIHKCGYNIYEIMESQLQKNINRDKEFNCDFKK